MMKELKKQFYLRWNDLALILLLQTGLFYLEKSSLQSWCME
ncbi:hypothetical protein C823_004376 [Eubacterium plexicaudatum ASF492]|nr:hypothetical protein C823_004376 [Eubacterium plexicaudatum ASF492]